MLMSSGQHARKQKLAQVNNNVIIIIIVIMQPQTEKTTIMCGCPMVLINIFDCWFAKVFACVRWGECISEFVSLSCGTRQGGVASPTLFAICVNDIIAKLQQSGLGCQIHFISFNAFMYADDLLLLALSVGFVN